MIFQNRNKLPFIHFGFNKQSFTVEVDEDLTIWQDEIYNLDVFDGVVLVDAVAHTTINNNKAVISFGSVGTYEIIFNIQTKTKTKTKTLASNTITLDVV